MKKEFQAGTTDKQRTEADKSTSASVVSKPNVSSRLSFYRQPFKKDEYIPWVYDDDGNFVFQFISDFEVLQEDVIKSINSDNHKPISGLDLSVSESDPNYILNNDIPFILIRGWGNLTGPGAHNFSEKKAAKIQDDFRDWLIAKLSLNGC